eukprot:4884291-Amphidinium_carterae.1
MPTHAGTEFLPTRTYAIHLQKCAIHGTMTEKFASVRNGENWKNPRRLMASYSTSMQTGAGAGTSHRCYVESWLTCKIMLAIVFNRKA